MTLHGVTTLGRQRTGQSLGLWGGRPGVLRPAHSGIHHRRSGPPLLYSDVQLVFGDSWNRVREAGSQA